MRSWRVALFARFELFLPLVRPVRARKRRAMLRYARIMDDSRYKVRVTARCAQAQLAGYDRSFGTTSGSSSEPTELDSQNRSTLCLSDFELCPLDSNSAQDSPRPPTNCYFN